ncbi:unnamed protein product [Sphagnum balticum]
MVWRNARCVLPPPLQLLRQRKLQGCRQQEGEKQYTLHRQAAGGRTQKPLQQRSQKPQALLTYLLSSARTKYKIPGHMVYLALTHHQLTRRACTGSRTK